MAGKLPGTPFALAALLLACGADPQVSAPASSAVASYAGTYQVRGTTVETETGAERPISGTVILTEGEAGYTWTFSMKTTLPGEGGPVKADVIGKGEGRVDGRELSGTSETQLVVSAIPGVDVQFAYVPRTVSTRIVSRTQGSFEPDGSFTVQIESEAAPGEVYRPTRTTLRGSRVAKSAESK